MGPGAVTWAGKCGRQGGLDDLLRRAEERVHVLGHLLREGGDDVAISVQGQRNPGPPGPAGEPMQQVSSGPRQSPIELTEEMIPVGTDIAASPPHRSQRAE